NLWRLAQLRHPLAPWAALRYANHPEAPVTRRRRLLRELAQRDWPGRVQARLALATLEQVHGNPDVAERLWRTLWQNGTPLSVRAQAGYAWATALQRRGDRASLRMALDVARTLAYALPLHAKRQAAALLAERLAQALGLDEVPPTATEALNAGRALFVAGAFRDAKRHFETQMQAWRENAALHCQAGQMALRAGARIEPDDDILRAVQVLLERCDDTETRVIAHFWAARVLTRQKRYAEAVQHDEALASVAPQHSLADDALLHAANLSIDAGQAEQQIPRLRRLVQMLPVGDMHAQGRFHLAWLLWHEGKHDEALHAMHRATQSEVVERQEAATEGRAGRSHYWHARWLEETGARHSAQQAYFHLIERWPWRYHAQLAMQRLERLAAGKLRLWQAGRRAPERPRRWRFPAVPAWALPTLQRARALLQVGALPQAQQELDAVLARASAPLHATRGKGTYRPGNGDDAASVLPWVVVALLQAADALPQAMRQVRPLRRQLPPDDATPAWVWHLAYPRAYQRAIHGQASRLRLPASFVWAVAREESNFNPRAVSSARAYGLLQIILPTATRVGRSLGIKVNAKLLLEPQANIKLGTHLMRKLLDRYDGHLGVVPSAYNAGPTAASRWLTQGGDRDLDAWVESIPYRETRRYTRRVLQSYGIYHWLEQGSLPALPSQLPAPG
ncbi:MAG: transglycosylase SLT domain-containing protein, partial [Polyangiales bacterium]